VPDLGERLVERVSRYASLATPASSRPNGTRLHVDPPSLVIHKAPSPVMSSCPEPRTQPRCADTKLTSLAAKPGRAEAGGLLAGAEASAGEAAADAAAEAGVELERAARLEVPQAGDSQGQQGDARGAGAHGVHAPRTPHRASALDRWMASPLHTPPGATHAASG
jgi:hypothetical protein